MKSQKKRKNAADLLRSKYHTLEDFSEEMLSERKSKLKNLNRQQLELLICALSKEIFILEEVLNSCASCCQKLNNDTNVNSTSKLSEESMPDSNGDAMKALQPSNCKRGQIRNRKKTGNKNNSISEGKKPEDQTSFSEFLELGNSRGQEATQGRKCDGDLHNKCELQNASLNSHTYHQSVTGGGYKEVHQASFMEGMAGTVADHRVRVRTRSQHKPKNSLWEETLAREGLVIHKDKNKGGLRVVDMHTGQIVYDKLDMKCLGKQETVAYSNGNKECGTVNTVLKGITQEGNSCIWQSPIVDRQEKGSINETFHSVPVDAPVSRLRGSSKELKSNDVSSNVVDGWSQDTANVPLHDNCTAVKQCSLDNSKPPAIPHTEGSTSNTQDEVEYLQLDAVKGKKSKFSCPDCRKEFQRSTDLNQHARTAHQCSVYPCLICRKAFKYKHNLKIHLKNNHSRETVLCSYCGKLVLCVRLKTHMEKVHEKPSYTCHICHKGFLKRECLEGHINKHSNTKPYICEFCGRKYAYSTSLSSHKKTCSKATVPSHLLHPKNPEEKDTIHVCEVCGIKFEGTSGLKDHYNAKHGTKLLCCNFCGKNFQWRPSYNRHVKKCRDRTVDERKKFQRPERLNPTGKQYACICGKQYPYRQSFRRHQKTCQQKRDVESYVATSIPMDIPFSEYLGSSLELSSTLNI